MVTKFEKESIPFEIIAQLVPPSSSYTLQIPLNSFAYTQGDVLMYLPNVSGVPSDRRRQPCFIEFGLTTDSAISQAGAIDYYSGHCGIIRDHKLEVWTVLHDGKLSDTRWSASGGQLSIKSCVIVEDNVEIEFENTHGSITATLSMIGRVNVR